MQLVVWERRASCAICGFHSVASEGYSILGQDFCVNWWYDTGIFEKLAIVFLGEFPHKITILPWRWKLEAPPKHQQCITSHHGVISHMTVTFRSVLLNDNVNCYDHTESKVDGWTSKEPRCNDKDRGKPKYWERNLSHCHFVHHKSYVYWPRNGARPLWWKAGDSLSSGTNWHLTVYVHHQVFLEVISEL